ncbi:peptide deformylase [Devosia faecipullorum]|uniref:peptide deformylase n=1 Tax=Devosia faecipullorum TaxID=2755039 RepID=UPI00187B6FD4|nr:peptide deformylase [Devosia faecipullorum]MBE7731715.1 peptide deformylase [Devosia faecipullorum]
MTQPADIVLYPAPVLSLRANPRPLDEALVAIGRRLLATAQHHRAYGLAASHIGEAEPVAVVSFGPEEGRDYHLLFNPQILSLSAQTVMGPEGSVSLPGVEADISRAISIFVTYEDAEGESQNTELSGFTARVAQHEIDQMNGMFFLDRLSRLKRDAALRRYRKLSR